MIATIETHPAEGLALDLLELDHEAVISPLREDPRREKSAGAGAAKVAAQVKAARDAGLL